MRPSFWPSSPSDVKYITPPRRRHHLLLFLPSFPALTSLSHHDGLVRVRASSFFRSPSDPLFPCPSLAFSSTLADPCSWPTPSPLDSTDPLDVFDPILYPTFEREIVRFPSSRVACLILLRVSAPTLRAAGSTSQTCTSCSPTSRPRTSSRCPSSPRSRCTTLWETRFMTWRPRSSVFPSHVRYPRGHIHARRVPVYPPWTASRIQQRRPSVWRARPVRRTSWLARLRPSLSL